LWTPGHLPRCGEEHPPTNPYSIVDDDKFVLDQVERERERERERGEQENGWMLDDAEELATLHVNCVIDLIV
jgi:hypothetical protein